jgi:hypothetical protein
MNNTQIIDQIIQYNSLSLVINKIVTFKALIDDIPNIFIKNFNHINWLLSFQNINTLIVESVKFF